MPFPVHHFVSQNKTVTILNSGLISNMKYAISVYYIGRVRFLQLYNDMFLNLCFTHYKNLYRFPSVYFDMK